MEDPLGGASQGSKYWFPAHKVGWGWGFPIAWQGWVVFGAYMVSSIGGGVWVLAKYGMAPFLAVVFAVSAAFFLICWLKGEPPSWR